VTRQAHRVGRQEALERHMLSSPAGQSKVLQKDVQRLRCPLAGPPQLPWQVTLPGIWSGLLEWGLSWWVVTAVSQPAGTVGPQWRLGPAGIFLASPQRRGARSGPSPKLGQLQTKGKHVAGPSRGFSLPHLGEQ